MSDEPKTIPMPFIPGWFDDLKISMLAFRLASRIYRRGNEAFDSITKMEREFKVSNRTMAGALKELLDLKLIAEEKRKGLSSIFRPSALQHHPLVLTSTTTQCSTTPPPSALQHHKGTPSKANHLKQSIEGNANGFLFDQEASLPFNSESFKTAWQTWIQHRKEKKKKLTPESIKMQFKDMIAMGEERSIAAINHSVKNGYAGIYEPSANQSNKTTNQQTRTVDTSNRPADITYV